MKKYYNILGLNEHASEREIRKAYRRLALQYHPDKNSDPAAVSKFLEITNAYEILTGKVATVKQTSTVKNTESTPQKTKEERIKEARERQQEIEKIRQLRRQAYYKRFKSSRIWTIHKWIAWVGLVSVVILLLDQFLPTHHDSDRLIAYAKDVYLSSDLKSSICYFSTEKGYSLWVSHVDYHLIHEFPEVIIERTWLLHDPISLSSQQGFYIANYPIHYTFSTSSLLTSLVFLNPFLTRYFWRDNDVFVLLFYLGTFPVGLLTVYFLLVRFHVLHLLTLGFF